MAVATFANPWHDEIGRFAPKGTGTRHPLTELMGDWETSKPWNLTKEQAIAGDVPGFRHKEARETETASWDGKHIRTTDEFYALPEETRRAIAYHEAGHAMLEAAGGLTTIDDPLGLIDKPGGQALGHNAEEILAEGYSALWSDPDWFDRMSAHEIRGVVVAAASRAGFPLPRGVTPDEYNADAWKPPTPTGPRPRSQAAQRSTATSADSTSTTTPATTSAPTRAGSSSALRPGSRNVCGSSARASFANPWHDEIGRFAPKGTGRRASRRVPKGDKDKRRLDLLHEIVEDHDDLSAGMAAMPENLISVHGGDEEGLKLFAALSGALKRGDGGRIQALGEEIYQHLTREVGADEPLIEGYKKFNPHPSAIQSDRQLWRKIGGVADLKVDSIMVEGVDAYGRAQPIMIHAEGSHSLLGIQERISLLNGVADAYDMAPIGPSGTTPRSLTSASSRWHSPVQIMVPARWTSSEKVMAQVELAAPTTIKVNRNPMTWRDAEEAVRANDHNWMESVTVDNLYQYIGAHEYAHIRMWTNHDNRAQIIGTAANWDDDTEGTMSPYGQEASTEAHAEAFADWVITDGQSTNPATRSFVERLGWEQYRDQPLAAAGPPPDDEFDGLVAIGEGIDGPTFFYEDGTVVHHPITASAAQFMNPWHDEIGRFAPKGTGRNFGASQEEMRSLFDPVRPLVDVLEAAGAKTYLVGGSVRDRLTGYDSKDIDIEVHDLPVEDTIEMLEAQGARVDEVGKAFGVLKVTFNGETHDFSFPRTEVKTGEGHTGFDVTVDPSLGIEQALARRDFTMNALAVDSDGNLVDPFGGVDDLRNGILRHVGPAFSEDPLRILRGVQFAGRFGFRFDPETARLAHDLLPELEAMHENRVWGEFEKLGTKGTSMHAAAQAIQDVGLDQRYGDIVFSREPNLDGLSGDHRAAVALASIGIDPQAIGAPRDVARHMADVYTALAFDGDPAASRATARELKYGTFADAERIAGPADNVDPRVLDGPLPALVSGNDVMARGIRGPAIGDVLRAVQRAQDADTITTREEALDWLDRNAATSVRRNGEFANPWHDEIGRFAPKGTGTAVEIGGDRGYDEYVKYIDDPFNSPNPYWGGMSFDDPRKDAFYSYFQGHAEPMNAWLRGVGEASEVDRRHAQNLGELIDSAGGVKRDIIVFRGLNKDTLPDLNPGDEITDPGFMSTSFSRRIAARGRVGMETEVLEITAPEGTKAMMGYAGMDEVIVQRGTTLRVDAVTEEGGQRWIKATIVSQ